MRKNICYVVFFALALLAACTPPNTLPEISRPDTLSFLHNTLSQPEIVSVAFTIRDAEDVVQNLEVSATSNNPDLARPATPACNSTGACTLDITLAKTVVSTTTVTLNVQDTRTGKASSSFSITVAPEEKTVASGAELKALLESALPGTSLRLTNTTPLLLDTQILLDKELTLWGLGLAQTTLDAQNLDRLFWVRPNGKVTLHDLTLTNGKAKDDASTLQDEPLGGAIFNEGLLTLENVRITGSQAVRGGAVYTLGPSGVTVIRDSIIGQENARNIASRSGGGLFNDAGRLEVYSSEISFNEGSERGGGIYNYLETAVLIVEDTTLFSNFSWDGTAIKNELGKVTIRGSTLENNIATQVEGGAIFNLSGRLEIFSSTINNNQTLVGSGGAIYSLGPTSYVLLDATTVTNNKAASTGGAIYNEIGAGLLELRNGTKLTGNTAARDGGAIFNGGQLKISPDCQVTLNTANTANGSFAGGGLFNAGTLVETDTNVLTQVFTNNQPDNVFTPPPGLRYIASIGKFVLVNKTY